MFELLRLIAHEDRENPSKETSAFINRALVLYVKKCLEEAESKDEHVVVGIVQELLDHLRNIVSDGYAKHRIHFLQPDVLYRLIRFLDQLELTVLFWPNLIV